MSRFAVLVLCVQACLIQSALSQQISYGPSGVVYNSLNHPSINVNTPSVSVPNLNVNYGASYGGSGTGKVGVSGDIGASGQTVVVGAVPVLGSVDFRGTVPASGSVSISGQCGCGCN